MSHAGPPPSSSSPPPLGSYTPTGDELSMGLRFSNLMGMQTKLRLSDVAAGFFALLDLLVEAGAITKEAFEQRRQQMLEQESNRIRSEALVVINNEPDKYLLTDLPQIDCAARLPLCRARCCSLTFALSAQDLDEGIVRWDLARPYLVRQGTDGYCVHNQGENRGCGVYAFRPGICRTYDCRNDKRIWIDFEQRIPADEATFPVSRR